MEVKIVLTSSITYERAKMKVEPRVLMFIRVGCVAARCGAVRRRAVQSDVALRGSSQYVSNESNMADGRHFENNDVTRSI